MRILAIVKDGENIHQLRKLIGKGHTVKIINSTENVPYNYIDVVVSLSEKTVEDAFNISQRYNIPFYAHMDWIPPWMVFKESEFNWGYIDKIPFSTKMNFIRRYQNLAMYWSMADVKSMSADCFHDLMREITGIKDLTIYTRYPRPDIEKISKLATMEGIDVVNEISCVSRFTPHKRIQHIIKALQMIEFDGTLNLIGSGEEKSLYEAIKGDIKIKFISDLDKFETLARSRLVISLWNATSALEGLVLGVPVITYDSKYMREICGDMIKYVTNNSISELAKEIDNSLSEEQKDKDFTIHEDEMLEKLLMKAVRK